MYDRRVDGKILSFGHSGILYKWSFVLYDRQSESLWVQANGMAEHGPMKGKRLRLIPSTVTSWTRWKTAYPHTEVLPGQRSGYFYGSFHGMKHTRNNIGLVVLSKFKGKLFPYGELAYEPIVNDRFNGLDVVVVFSSSDGTSGAWERRLDGRTLTFDPKPVARNNHHFLIRDQQTSTMWDWLTGKGVSGPLQGRQLQKAQSNPMLIIRFDGFYPGGPVFESRLRIEKEQLEASMETIP